MDKIVKNISYEAIRQQWSDEYDIQLRLSSHSLERLRVMW